jgi:hypothetical protein
LLTAYHILFSAILFGLKRKQGRCSKISDGLGIGAAKHHRSSTLAPLLSEPINKKNAAGMIHLMNDHELNAYGEFQGNIFELLKRYDFGSRNAMRPVFHLLTDLLKELQRLTTCQ